MNKFFTMLKTELKLSFRGMDMVIFALCMPVSGCCNFGSHLWSKNSGSRSKIYLFGTVLRGIIDHCDLCRWCDGASAVDFRLSSEKDIKKI